MDALAKAREIAARLSGSVGTDLGKRKNRWDDDGGGGSYGPGLGSIEKKKVYIPQSEHPDINFLGLLIGPKGITQKQMQDMSGAKIIIRGRGASKDGGPSNTGHPDDNDDLHVSIEGTSDSVARAWKEIEQILYNPEQALKLKAAQLSQLQSSDIYGPGDSGSGGYSLELKVPNNMVGLVIGKGGENILRIQSQLGVHAQIAKEHEMLPGETMRSITLKGTPAAVAEAKTRIDDIISAQLMKMGGGNNIKDMHEPFIVKLPVPNDKVGIIIGKGGMTIKGIQERCGVNVQIPTGPDEDDPLVRTLAIGGNTKEAIDAAQMEIFMTLQSQQQLAQATYNSTANAMIVVVPDDKVGIIIGKQGATVKDIQNRLRVKVQIPQQADLGTNPPVRSLSVVGTVDMQAQAKYEIEMIVAGTPVPGSVAAQVGGYSSSSQSYSSSSGSSWGASAAYGMAAAASYYSGATAGAYGGYGGQSYDAMAYYGLAGAAGVPAANPYAAYTAAAATTVAAVDPTAAAAAAAATEVPTDPTAYYNDYWTYAAYYGEAAARLYYGAWSPPEGTPPPAGVVVAPDSAATAAVTDAAASSSSAAAASSSEASSGESEAKKARNGDSAGNNASASDSTAAAAEDPEAAWEAYKKQYAEWYEAYGKAAGADPNPPMSGQ